MRTAVTKWSPTDSQLEFCRLLGVEVPVAATNAQVSELIRVGRIRTASQLLRAAQVKIGSITSKKHDDNLYVVTNPMAERIHFRRVDTGSRDDVSTFSTGPDGKLALNLTLVYNAPAEWLHSLAVRPKSVRDERGSRFLRLCDRLIGFIDKRLSDGERMRTQHGEFWLRSSIDRLTPEFEASE